jgi:hypothetical protein
LYGLGVDGDNMKTYQEWLWVFLTATSILYSIYSFLFTCMIDWTSWTTILRQAQGEILCDFQ